MKQMNSVYDISNSEVMNMYASLYYPRIMYYFLTEKLTFKQSVIKFLKENKQPINENLLNFVMVNTIAVANILEKRNIFVLFEDCMKSGCLNLTNADFQNKVQSFKDKFIIDGNKNLTSFEFIKLIRNRFAHNNQDEEKSDVDYEINYDGSGLYYIINDENCSIRCSNQDVLSLLKVMFEAFEKELNPLYIYEKRLENALIGNYFYINNIDRYILRNDEDNPSLNFDDHQKLALTNFFKMGKTFNLNKTDKQNYCFCSVIGDTLLAQVLCDSKILSNMLPLIKQPEVHAINKNIALSTIIDELYLDYDQTVDDLIIKNINNDELPEEIMMLSNFMLTNKKYYLGSIFTSSFNHLLSNIEFSKLEQEIGDLFDKKEMRCIRDALTHGTYFFDFDGGVEIYDGTKKLKHKGRYELARIGQAVQNYAISRLRDINQKNESQEKTDE